MGEGCMVLNISSYRQNLGVSKVDQYDCVLPSTLKVLSDNERNIYMIVFVVLSVLSLCGNCAAIYSISKRKYRYMQKTCIISLAVSDILSTIIIATNNIETFSHELLTWTMGSFLCSLIPMLQMTGIMASSIALVFIAIDRYRNVVHALSKRWNPLPCSCHCMALFLWFIVSCISYPMYDFFSQANVTIVYLVDFETQTFNYVDASVCLSFDKTSMMIYYIVMVILIFLPLLLVFLWSYYHIASLVWKHRKPVVSSVEKNENSAVDPSTSNSEIRIRNDKKVKKSNDIRVERKIRTFKIIIMLMLVFIACRLPYFTVYIMKLTGDENGTWLWNLNYSFVALHIVNCCLNPLLYTFLNPTLTLCIRVRNSIKEFVLEICCFCVSNAEFNEFEKENPFQVKDLNMGRVNSKVKFEENVKEIEAKY